MISVNRLALTGKNWSAATIHRRRKEQLIRSDYPSPAQRTTDHQQQQHKKKTKTMTMIRATAAKRQQRPRQRNGNSCSETATATAAPMDQQQQHHQWTLSSSETISINRSSINRYCYRFACKRGLSCRCRCQLFAENAIDRLIRAEHWLDLKNCWWHIRHHQATAIDRKHNKTLLFAWTNRRGSLYCLACSFFLQEVACLTAFARFCILSFSCFLVTPFFPYSLSFFVVVQK